MRVPITNLSSPGIISDVSPQELPIDAWSNGLNVRFKNGRVERIRGYAAAFNPTIDANFLLPVNSPAGYFWLHAGNAAVNAYKDNTIYNISKVGGYAAVGQQWTGGVLNGVAILNNPQNPPQQWTPPGGATLLADLSNWPGGWTARSLRPFGNFLVALGVDKGTGRNPYSVNWSHPADPGTVPSSWNIADPTKDAGENILAETNGELIDQCPLGANNIIYKSDSAYLMQFIGGIDIFGFRKIPGVDGGLLVPNGVKAFKKNGGYHFVLGPNDIYVHDGNSATSVVRGRMRDWFYNNLSASNYQRSFVAHNINESEILVCFPIQDSVMPNTALVWNYETNNCTIRELPQVGFMETGQLLETLYGGDDSWDAASGTWDTDQAVGGQGQYVPVGSRMVGITQGTGRKAFAFDIEGLFDTLGYASNIERLGLCAFGKDYKGQTVFDTDSVKLVTEIWPRFRGVRGDVIQVQIGTQMAADDPIKWEAPLPFRIGIDEKVNPFVSGKILSIRFSHFGTSHWDCAGYDLEVQNAGRY